MYEFSNLDSAFLPVISAMSSCENFSGGDESPSTPGETAIYLNANLEEIILDKLVS